MAIDNNIFVFLALLVAFLISFSATPMVIALAPKINAVDVPKDSRRIHKKPIPRIGGLAIFYGFIISVMCFAVMEREVMGILIGSVIIVTVGVVDDIVELNAKVKLLFQIIVAAIVVYFGVRIENVANPFSAWVGGPYINLGWMSIPLTMIWIIGVTNAVNLIDGLDGLAVGVSSISSLTVLALMLISQNPNVAVLTAAVAGASFGFLPYNFNPAKIFMGDTGSTFLGYILACISVLGLLKMYALISFVVPLLILGLPIFDTLFAIIRRAVTGKPIMAPDRGHLHHRLLDMGFSQRQTVMILYTMTAVLCMTAVVISLRGAMRGLILILAVLAVIILSAVVMDKKSDDLTSETDVNSSGDVTKSSVKKDTKK